MKKRSKSGWGREKAGKRQEKEKEEDEKCSESGGAFHFLSGIRPRTHPVD